jgi:hypothetical protein
MKGMRKPSEYQQPAPCWIPANMAEVTWPGTRSGAAKAGFSERFLGKAKSGQDLCFLEDISSSRFSRKND